MIKLKYAGLCAAGLAMNLACLLIDWLFCYIFDLFYTVSIGLFIIVGAVLCIGSGFLHVAFMNIIRKRLMISSKWYFLTVFAALVVLCGLGDNTYVCVQRKYMGWLGRTWQGDDAFFLLNRNRRRSDSQRDINIVYSTAFRRRRARQG